RVAVHGDVETDPRRRSIEAVEVVLEPEDAPVVDADSLEHPVAVEKAMIEEREGSLLAPGYEASGEIDGGGHGFPPNGPPRRGSRPRAEAEDRWPSPPSTWTGRRWWRFARPLRST